MISENIKINEYERVTLEEVYARSLSNGKIPLETFINTVCRYCQKPCIHKDAYRRMPQEVGGLGLCANLK